MSIAPSGVALRSGAWLCSSAEAVDIKARVLIVMRVYCSCTTSIQQCELADITRLLWRMARRYPQAWPRHAATKPFWRMADAVIFQSIPRPPAEMTLTSLTSASGLKDTRRAPASRPASKSSGWARPHACQHHRCMRHLINIYRTASRTALLARATQRIQIT